MIPFIQEIFKGTNGSYSSKRFITLVAFFLLSLAFVMNLVWGYGVDEMLIDTMAYIVMFGMGAATAEPMANSRFMNRAKTKPKVED